MEQFVENSNLILFSTFIISLLIGSFLSVVIYRLPKITLASWQKQREHQPSKKTLFNLAYPSSHCPHCKQKLRWIENIPVLSYLIQTGKCKHCKETIAISYPLLEIGTAIISTWIVACYGITAMSLALLCFTWALICLSLIDAQTQLLPDSITLPLLATGILVNYFNFFTDLSMAIVGAVLGYLSFWLVHYQYKKITGKQGMGGGDLKLLAALGAWAGAEQLLLIIILSSLLGSLSGIIMIVIKHHKVQNPIPFGPYLAIAGWAILIYGSEIQEYYQQMIKLCLLLV